MPAEYLALSYWQLGIAASLVLINATVSFVLRLGLGRLLLLASVRTVVQLLLVGLVLEWIFAAAWYFVLPVMLFMAVVAGLAAVRRTGHRYRGIWLDSVVSVWASSWLITAVAVFAVVQAQQKPEFLARYAIPLLGMILGNTLNGISLGLDRLGEELSGKRDQVETLLALGATRWEAAREPIQRAVRTGMMPLINNMMVVGLVSLPGMMTGQLFSGVEPLQAAMYQIAIMFVLAAATSLGTLSVVLLGYRRLFNKDHQFLRARLVRR